MVKPYAGSDFEEYRRLAKKDHEIRLVIGLLQRLGLTGFRVTANERPDALITFDDFDRVYLGCEIQTLHADDDGSGSELREFHARWLQVMERVIATLEADGVATPYCTVWFSEPSYSCLHEIANDDLVTDLVNAGRRLRRMSKIAFPQTDLPILNALLSEIRVVEADGEGLLWWPTHLKSGVVSPLDESVAKAVASKGALAASYDWRGAQERLLLLVAEGRGLTDLIGGARDIDLCRSSTSPFTWIVVWDKFSEDVWAVFPAYSIICDGHRRIRRPEMLPLALQRFSTAATAYPTRPKRR